MRKIINNQYGSAIPLLLYVISIIGLGALYTLLFIEVAYPSLLYMVPESDSKIFIMMGMYSLPLLLIVIGVLALIKSGLKKNYEVYQ